MTLTPPTAILSGIRATDVNGIAFDGELFFASGQWAIRVILDLSTEPDSELRVPARSEWFAVVGPDYPLGSVSVYPSKTNGIIATFEHQELNLPGPEDLPWRTGKICLDSPVDRLGLVASGKDPVGEREERLEWYLTRAVTWVQAAIQGTLVQDGDPFELPYYPVSVPPRVVHDESNSTFDIWKNVRPGSWGIVVWDVLANIEKTVVGVAFLHRDDQETIRRSSRYNEACHGEANADRRIGIWWLWPAPIVLEPWQVPLTWGELRTAGKIARINVDAVLREIARTIRGRNASILLLGYPIPLHRGETPTEIHWQSVGVPKLDRKGKPAKGFRPNEQGWWLRDKQQIFGNNQRLEYMDTVNWHPDRLQARGRYDESLRESKIALVGCGALGSLLVELLVRGGVTDILLIDHDKLDAGNLVRHTLSGSDISKNKTGALAKKLATVAPFASIIAHEKRLPTNQTELVDLLDDRQIVLDCTGTNDVLFSLGLGWWSLPRLFISACVGYGAKRLFVFAHRGHSFPQSDFRRLIEPEISKESDLWSNKGETIEGAGCWSPLFPARMDDMMLAAASCGKVIEELASATIVNSRLIVFEQVVDELFTGLKRTEVSACNSGI